jgi:hypothetical protein
MSDITDDVRLRFQHNVTALDWTFYLAVHDHALSSYASPDLSIRSDYNRRTTKWTLRHKNLVEKT